MITNDLLKELDSRNEKYIFKFEYLDNKYIQTIKVLFNKIEYNYYQIINNGIKKIKDNNLVYEFSNKFEMFPKDIYYDQISTVNVRTYNKEVTRFAKGFCITKLTQCDMLLKMYGEVFIRFKIKQLNAVYTNASSFSDSGYQSGHQITLCYSGKDDKLLSIEDIINSRRIQQVLLHEMIHFLLRRFLTNGTGMLIYVIKDFKELITSKRLYELGRGLNEGLTEWITKKIGYYVESSGYAELINFIEQLEVALGEENIMSLGNGLNIERKLNLTKEELYLLLSKSDRYYQLIFEIINLDNIIETGGYFRYISKFETDEEREVIIKSFGQLSKSEEYVEFKEGSEYKKYLINHNLQDSLVNFIKFCGVKRMKVVGSKQELATEIEDFIFSKYFSKEFEELLQKDKIPRDLMEKYIKLQGLIKNKDRKKEIEELKDKYLDGIRREIKEKYNNNSLSIADIDNYVQELSILKKRVTELENNNETKEGERS